MEITTAVTAALDVHQQPVFGEHGKLAFLLPARSVLIFNTFANYEKLNEG